MNEIQLSFICQIDGLTFDCKILCDQLKVLRSCGCKNKPTSTPLHPRAGQLVLICCLIFASCAAVDFDQRPPFWTPLSKGHHSRSLVVCSDETWQTKAVLPRPFWREEAFSKQAILVQSLCFSSYLMHLITVQSSFRVRTDKHLPLTETTTHGALG